MKRFLAALVIMGFMAGSASAGPVIIDDFESGTDLVIHIPLIDPDPTIRTQNGGLLTCLGSWRRTTAEERHGH